MHTMTTRRVELGVAALLALFALYLMAKAAELPIGWVAGQGPGGGALPFWVSAIMFAASLAVLARAWRGQTPPSREEGAFIQVGSGPLLGAVVGSLVALLLLIHLLGVYVAIPLFLAFHLRVLGRHSWRLTGTVMAATPVTLFFVFEVALKTMLPKGLTEPFFYPLYALFL